MGCPHQLCWLQQWFSFQTCCFRLQSHSSGCQKAQFLSFFFFFISFQLRKVSFFHITFLPDIKSGVKAGYTKLNDYFQPPCFSKRAHLYARIQIGTFQKSHVDSCHDDFFTPTEKERRRKWLFPWLSFPCYSSNLIKESGQRFCFSLCFRRAREFRCARPTDTKRALSGAQTPLGDNLLPRLWAQWEPVDLWRVFRSHFFPLCPSSPR